MRHDLASGNWVEIRPIQSLKEKDREAYNAPLDMEIGVKGSGDSIEMDLSERRYSTATPRAQRKALLARLITGWSFFNDDGTPLVVPEWTDHEIVNVASFGEVPLDDWDELDEFLKPYIDKIQKRPDPKDGRSRTSTASNGSLTTKAGRSRPA